MDDNTGGMGLQGDKSNINVWGHGTGGGLKQQLK